MSGRAAAALTGAPPGLVADAADGVDQVFAWFDAGAVPIRLPDGSEGNWVSEASARHLTEAWAEVRVLIAGRRTFDLSDGWHGSPPLGLPTVVVTHQIPQGWKSDGNPFTFVTDGVESAIAQARAMAGDGIVAVSGANITQQCISAGLLDEISIDLVAVILGAGVRYFDGLTGTPIRLDTPDVVEGMGVTHLTYRIGRS